MLTDPDTDKVVRKVTDELEVDPFVEPADRIHHDRHVHHTHELHHETSEATSRALIRVVPLAYGALLGGLADSLALGLAAGMTVSMAFDLFMGNNSLVRGLSRRLFGKMCPTIAALAHGLANLITRLGLAASPVLRRPLTIHDQPSWRQKISALRCKSSQ